MFHNRNVNIIASKQMTIYVIGQSFWNTLGAFEKQGWNFRNLNYFKVTLSELPCWWFIAFLCLHGTKRNAAKWPWDDLENVEKKFSLTLGDYVWKRMGKEKFRAFPYIFYRLTTILCTSSRETHCIVYFYSQHLNFKCCKFFNSRNSRVSCLPNYIALISKLILRCDWN